MLTILFVLLASPTPEQRAIAYLEREVPAWSVENKCYSCHNNANAASALYLARGAKLIVSEKALADTTAWLLQPDRWDKNGGQGPFSDKKLARIQFAAALATALDQGATKEESALRRAAELLADVQDADGSWQVDANSTGSPATLGTTLATALGRKVLYRADALRYRANLDKAARWLDQRKITTVVEAGVLLATRVGLSDDRALLKLIRQGEGPRGGWGPYVNSPPEPFDTAIVLNGLVQHGHDPTIQAMIERGRAYLIATQKEDGSWPETTRPPGAESYAQRLSTTGWALQALLLTAPTPEGRRPPP